MSNSVDPDEPSHLDLRCLQSLLLSPMVVKELSAAQLYSAQLMYWEHSASTCTSSSTQVLQWKHVLSDIGKRSGITICLHPYRGEPTPKLWQSATISHLSDFYFVHLLVLVNSKLFWKLSSERLKQRFEIELFLESTIWRCCNVRKRTFGHNAPREDSDQPVQPEKNLHLEHFG